MSDAPPPSFAMVPMTLVAGGKVLVFRGPRSGGYWPTMGRPEFWKRHGQEQFAAALRGALRAEEPETADDA